LDGGKPHLMIFIDQQVVSGVFASTCVLSGDIRLEFDLNKKPDALQLQWISARLRHSFDIILPAGRAVQDTVQLA
jgi:hypothetical protein